MRWPSSDPAGWNTLRARLTLWNTAVVMLMTAVTLGSVWLAARAALYREADAILGGAVREVASAVAELHPDIDAVVDMLRRKTAAHQDRGWFTHVLAVRGTTLWMSPNCPPEVAAYPPTRTGSRENIVQLGSYRYVRVAIDWPGVGPLFVRIGMATTFLDETIAALMRLLFAVGGILSLLTPLAAYWLAGRATQPVAEILRTAERLRPTRLGDRLTVTGTGDELDRLSLTINRLLDQVAEHVDRQERFVADAAHELRGPLTVMQSLLEVAVSQDRTASEYRETVTDVLEAARHLAKLTNDLLLLAESAEASAPRNFEPVNLAAVTRKAVEMFAGVAEEQGVTLELEADARPMVTGDSGRLRQVIGNLLDNALRFTSPGGRVTVEVAAGGADALLTVRDSGSGIPADQLRRIFDRFAMADPARSHAGSERCGGLGLAICKAIVEASGGSIGITSNPGVGTTVAIRLPACSEPLAPRAEGRLTTVPVGGR